MGPLVNWYGEDIPFYEEELDERVELLRLFILLMRHSMDMNTILVDLS